MAYSQRKRSTEDLDESAVHNKDEAIELMQAETDLLKSSIEGVSNNDEFKEVDERVFDIEDQTKSKIMVSSDVDAKMEELERRVKDADSLLVKLRNEVNVYYL